MALDLWALSVKLTYPSVSLTPVSTAPPARKELTSIPASAGLVTSLQFNLFIISLCLFMHSKARLMASELQ